MNNPIIVSDLRRNKTCHRLLDVNGGTALFNLADLINAQETDDAFYVNDGDDGAWYELTHQQFNIAIQLLTMGVSHFVNVYEDGRIFVRREYLDAFSRGNANRGCRPRIVCRVHVRLKK